MTISSTFRNTSIRAVYLISYIQRGNGTDTTFHRTYSCGFNIFRGFRSTGGRNFHFPIDFAGHRYNSAATTAQPVMRNTSTSFEDKTLLMMGNRKCIWIVIRQVQHGLDWIEQGLTSPPTQYRLSGRQFYNPTSLKIHFWEPILNWHGSQLTS